MKEFIQQLREKFYTVLSANTASTHLSKQYIREEFDNILVDCLAEYLEKGGK